MKKMIFGVIGSLLLAANSFAFELTAGLKGSLGGDNTGISGLATGGGVYVNLDLINGFGFQFEGDITTCKLAADGGLVVNDLLLVNIPAMVWYNQSFGKFVIGGGAGVNASMFENKLINDTSDFKVTLAGGLNAKWYLTDTLGIVCGAFGTLDCFPTIVSEKNGSSTKYNSITSDFARNTLNGFVGVEYKFLK